LETFTSLLATKSSAIIFAMQHNEYRYISSSNADIQVKWPSESLARGYFTWWQLQQAYLRTEYVVFSSAKR
jgi:hypothetical protein